MQGPQVQAANQDKFLSRGVTKGFRNHFAAEVRESVRKIRVICNDPDATDSSSDDETYVGARCRRGNSIVSSGGLSNRRKVIQEIVMPIPSSSCATLMVDAESSADSSSRKRTTSKSNNSIINKRKQAQVNRSFYFLPGNGKFGKYKGVRWRKWSRLAESSDPVNGVRVWLDTYDTAGDTARACERSSREMVGVSSTILAGSNNRKMAAISPVDSSSSCVSEDEDDRHLWPSSPSSVLDLSASSDSIPSGNFSKTTEAIDSHEDGGGQGESDAAGMYLMGFEGELMIPSSLYDPTGFQDALFGVDLGSSTNPIDWPVLNVLVGEAEEMSGIFEECLNLDIDAEVLSWLNF